MGYINSKGIYIFEEGDLEANASDLLNRLTAALTDRPAVVGGSGQIVLPAATNTYSVTIPLPTGVLGGTPLSVTLQNRSPVGHFASVDYRVSGKNASGFTVEARTSTSGGLTWLFDWVAVR